MVLAVVWSEVGQGVGLMAWGLAFGFFVRWQYTDPERREKNLRVPARAMGWFGKSEKGIRRDARSQVFLALWVFPAFGILFAGLAATLLIHGLTH